MCGLENSQPYKCIPWSPAENVSQIFWWGRFTLQFRGLCVNFKGSYFWLLLPKIIHRPRPRPLWKER